MEVAANATWQRTNPSCFGALASLACWDCGLFYLLSEGELKVIALAT